MDQDHFLSESSRKLTNEFPSHLTLHKELELCLSEQGGKIEKVLIRILSIENIAENCFHLALMVAQPDAWLKRFLYDIQQQVNTLRNSISVESGNTILGIQPRSTSTAVFSQNLYIYTNAAPTELKKELNSIAQSLQLQILWRDKNYWDRKLALQQGEIFLCHDSSDKPFVDQLSTELIKIGVTPWYDKISLQIGDSLIDKIHEGIMNCAYAVIVLSPSFINNHAWPNREFKSLTHKSLAARKNGVPKNPLLPIWRGVTQNEVMNYDLELSGIVALQAPLTEIINKNEVQSIASKIVTSMRS